MTEDFKLKPHDILLDANEGVQAVIEEFGGGMLKGGPGWGCESPIVKWPEDGLWEPRKSGHIDGGPGFHHNLMLGVTTYFHDVWHRGGCFCFWPCSHRTNWENFRENPDQSVHEDVPDPGWDMLSDSSPSGVVELAGRAGDVIFWHGFLMHGGSKNPSNHPRVSVIGRWARNDNEEIGGDVPDDMWELWGPALNGQS